MRSTSRLAVRIPDGDFFWNAWRTYSAFSNRTVYTARYAFPSCDSTTSSTPGPSPFHGFAVGGSAELRDAEGVSHVLLDGRGRAQEIPLGGPNPMQRLLAGSQDTSHPH